MKGPTMRWRAWGRARRTEKPPRSTLRGTMINSIASQAGLSPGAGSLPGKNVMANPCGAGPRRVARYIGPHNKHSKPDYGEPSLRFRRASKIILALPGAATLCRSIEMTSRPASAETANAEDELLGREMGSRCGDVPVRCAYQ